MADYINHENAFVVPSVPKRMYNHELSEYTEGGWISAHECNIQDYIRALEDSNDVTEKKLSDMRSEALKTIEHKYTDIAVRMALEKTIVGEYIR
jgi:hypothetical protein